MKNISKREKLVYATFISILLVIISLSTVTDIYAKYSSELLGSGDILLAKWLFKVNSSEEGETFEIEIASDDKNEEKISPNSTGFVAITVENESNVQASYKIELSETFKDTQISTYTLKLFTSEDFNENTLIDIDNQEITGKLDSNQTKTITLYWKWVETSQDQVIAENFEGFTISVHVTGEQTTISQGEDTSYKVTNKN